ncbi:Molybdenum cofactor biosynthesis protein MoaD [hydrothermal vent metagenome]|uniref:Molybdenum cofactor biosynthesis protein MoaD n=1 Tax=hydrothermal vent metagenome TaxID=652676 RepID=A0A1W1BGM7_9ZZZZ
MIKVEFLGPIGKEPLEIEASTLRELSSKLKADKELLEWLDISAVAVNDIMVNDLDIKLTSGDRVSILPPVCGG